MPLDPAMIQSIMQAARSQVTPVGDVVGFPPRTTGTGMTMNPYPGVDLTAEQLRKARDIQSSYPGVTDEKMATIIHALLQAMAPK